MASTVQVRLKPGTQAALERVARSGGWTTSEALRVCIHEADERRAAKPVPRLIGIGCVDFGPGDLATNKMHLRNLGAKSMGRSWRRPKDRAK